MDWWKYFLTYNDFKTRNPVLWNPPSSPLPERILSFPGTHQTKIGESAAMLPKNLSTNGRVTRRLVRTILPVFLQLVLSSCLLCVNAHSIQKRSTVCYQHIGCFSNTGAFASAQRPLTVTPASPDSIRTRFLLYTREDRTSGEPLDARYLDRTHFINQWTHFKVRPTKIIIHGFLDSPFLVTWLSDFTNELLVLDDFNVVTVDWSLGNLPPYTQATANTRVVGAQIALLIDLLVVSL
ncbi:pancreatic triacylglycerol lipase [Plakobranchus ocellatus]|uniref:Pancreatic triacylglycerol lipase n=1 Tax=Plakobranchus ocellatus TaxID=259542 RepID=A0AAV3ZMN8_9GAST|nr:pancreatic triacylglycerol lipase [Plakobranchus ocellatus]